jgi:diazepam-binding inhibitor (GABA receptor modulating acyl-CoA-binding protein)
MSLQDRFQKAADSVKSFTKRPSDDELLYTYSLYKQATIGDINIPEPSFFQFEQKSKWNAWNERKGMKKEVAMEKYIDMVTSLAKKYM